MSIELLIKFLGWSAIINLGLLMWWASFIIFAHDWVYRMHGKWFNLSYEQFDAIHYAGIAFYKLSIILFNVAPYLALRIIA
tara:strand:- start:5497 stop:5739 length:243 start_codon:yes stop_codon:yes gene_type:complete